MTPFDAGSDDTNYFSPMLILSLLQDAFCQTAVLSEDDIFSQIWSSGARVEQLAKRPGGWKKRDSSILTYFMIMILTILSLALEHNILLISFYIESLFAVWGP